MRRHRVPDASGSELCNAHHQLATARSFEMNEFRDLPKICGFSGAKRNLCLFDSSNELSRARRMSRITQQIELRRVGWIGAREYDLFIPTANVQSIQLRKLIRNAIHLDRAGTADIQNAEFPALGEIRCLERIVGRQRQRLASGHRRADHGAVEIDIG